MAERGVRMEGILLISIGLPAGAGIWLLISAFWEYRRGAGGIEETIGRKRIHGYTGVILTVSVILAMAAAWTGDCKVVLFQFLDAVPVYFHVDGMGKLFITIVSLIWLASGVYAFSYMKHEGGEKRFFGFFLLVYGVLAGFVFSGNLITMYLFYELITLGSMPLVLHNGTKEAAAAAKKYLFYSLCGAYGGLFGIFFLYRTCGSLDFVPGGTFHSAMAAGREGILLTAVFVMLVGFGAKAGMLPLHAWLPAAHPAAPTPASAVLSGVIAKAGVLAIVRVVFYVAGADFLKGTWVQYAWMTLALLTVFMGSMLAFRERGLKKRLAYSTVSQISYILFGLSLLAPEAMAGALLHAAAHGIIKCGLFLTAGIFLYCYGYTKVDQLAGLGKEMPKTLWCYTLFSLGLIGIPPTCGFISKWYLAQGSLQSEIYVFSWLGPAVLLVSALLTAGYLLPIVIQGFFPGKGYSALGEERRQKEKVPFTMLAPLIVLAGLTVFLGIFPNPLIRYVERIAAEIFGLS